MGSHCPQPSTAGGMASLKPLTATQSQSKSSQVAGASVKAHPFGILFVTAHLPFKGSDIQGGQALELRLGCLRSVQALAANLNPEVVFVFGDLNFRVQQSTEEFDEKQFAPLLPSIPEPQWRLRQALHPDLYQLQVALVKSGQIPLAQWIGNAEANEQERLYEQLRVWRKAQVPLPMVAALLKLQSQVTQGQDGAGMTAGLANELRAQDQLRRKKPLPLRRVCQASRDQCLRQRAASSRDAPRTVRPLRPTRAAKRSQPLLYPPAQGRSADTQLVRPHPLQGSETPLQESPRSHPKSTNASTMEICGSRITLRSLPCSK